MPEAVSDSPGRLSFTAKAVWFARVWVAVLGVHVGLRRWPLPDLIDRLGRRSSPRRRRLPRLKLSRMVERSLHVGPYRPRCIVGSLVLYRFLSEQGDSPELVIGLPTEPRDPLAHAWIEIEGVDLGPAPGRDGHEELARFG